MSPDLLTLDDYLSEYAPLLGEQANRQTQPLHIPGQHDHLKCQDLLRLPFDAQRHVITAGVRQLDRQNSLIVVGEMGVGKAQPLDSHVLTPGGFVEMKDIQVGSTVCTPDGTTAAVIGVYPQGVKDVYEITFSDESTVRCCDDHLWAVNTPQRKQIAFSNVR